MAPANCLPPALTPANIKSAKASLLEAFSTQALSARSALSRASDVPLIGVRQPLRRHDDRSHGNGSRLDRGHPPRGGLRQVWPALESIRDSVRLPRAL